MLLMSVALLFAVFQSRILPVASLTPWNVTASELVRTLWSTSILVDDWLYIEGGEYWLPGATSYGDINFQPTLSIDLSSSWSTSSVVINEIVKPPGLTSFQHPGLFWQDASKSYIIFGGTPYDTTQTRFPIWKLDLASGDGNWSEIQSLGPENQFGQMIAWPQGASFAYTPTGGYSVGGYEPTGTTATSFFNMTMVDATKNKFDTITSVGPFSTTGVIDGEALYIPDFGTGEGIIVIIGGYTLGSNGGSSFVHSMSSIVVYDIAPGQWYTQTAGGDVPRDRNDLCIAGTRDSNSNSYEIFVYGGCGLDFFGSDNDDSRNVYILTLPAFRWIRAPALTSPRAGPTCQIINHQMLSFGGWDPTGTTSYSNIDPWTYSIEIFDLTALTWSSNYNANAPPYARSEIVNEFYANNSLYPTWDNHSIATLFIQPTQATGTSSSVTPKNTNPTKNPSMTPKTPVAAIVGGVVGGVVGLIVLVCLIWFCRSKFGNRKGNGVMDEHDHLRQENPAEKAPVHIHELHGIHTYPELGTERRPELQG